MDKGQAHYFLRPESALAADPELFLSRKRTLFGIHHLDCRQLSEVLKGKLVDATITSPPYFNLKDYGSANQIGFGQTYEQYLDDLKGVFRAVFDVTKDSGSLWLIINTFRRQHELVALPFDVSRVLSASGWALQDIIIWKKERTVPWVPKGKTRSIFEYVLFLTKRGHKFKYYSDRVRDRETLKTWWVRYPERYNPKGKLPDEIWEYDIPLQGSWGSGEVRHFCPLPRPLIDRILDLVTDPGDVVLDPFAGSGTVLLEADARLRKWIGFETNASYVKRIIDAQRLESSSRQRAGPQSSTDEGSNFRTLILNLRTLKFARVLAKRLATDAKYIDTIFVESKTRQPPAEGKLRSALYLLTCERAISTKKRILRSCRELAKRPPLSKFGIDPTFRVVSAKSLKQYAACRLKLYGYKKTNTHIHFCKGAIGELLNTAEIISPIEVNVNHVRLKGG